MAEDDVKGRDGDEDHGEQAGDPESAQVAVDCAKRSGAGCRASPRQQGD